MGWSFRKSFGTGPFRVTLSNSGVSGSVGFKSLRVGANSRGSWISIGASGVRYRHFVPNRGTHGKPEARWAQMEDIQIPAGSHGPFEELQRTGIMSITDASSEDVLAELNSIRRRMPSAQTLGWLAVLLLTAGFFIAPFNLLLLAALTIRYFMQARKARASLWYDLDAPAARQWEALRSTVLSLKNAKRVWRVRSRAEVHDRRYHAGAAGLIDRVHIAICEGTPEGMDTNVVPVCVLADDLALHFFPDRLLIYRHTDIGGLGYHSLETRAALTSFIESDVPPSDARISGHTWQYVNRNGSPDRRFANNRQLPICEYDLLEMRSSSGLHVELNISRQGLAKGISAVLTQTGQIMSRNTVSQNAELPTQLPPPMPARTTATASERDSAPRPPSVPSPPPIQAATPPEKKPVPAPAESPPHPQLRWVEPAQPVEFAGLTMEEGMIYWHDGRHDMGEPSALSVHRPVADEAAPMNADLGYWPNYHTLTPEQRRAYLVWMAQGRRDTEPAKRALGFVFLFFYGIERRLLVDCDASPTLFEELIALLEHYGPPHRSNSLRSYFLQLLHFAGWQRGHAFYRALWPRLLALDEGRTNEDSLSLITAHLYLTGEPMPWELARRLAQADESSRNSTVVARASDKFDELFRHRYLEAFGSGITLAAAKTITRIDYRPASMALLTMKDLPKQRHLFELNIPNVRGLARQFKKLPQIWNSCVDDLSSYSRALVSKKADAVATWEALPAELRGGEPHPLKEPLARLIAGAPMERGFPLAEVSTLAAMLELPKRAKLTSSQSRQLAEALAGAGFHLAPNPLFTMQALSWDQPVTLYAREAGDENCGTHIPGLVRFLCLAVAVASADGSLDNEELEVFNRAVAGEITHDREWQHLRATEAALCRDANVAVRALAQISSHIAPQARHTVLRSLLLLSAADGEVSLEELRMLRRIARAFEVDEGWIDTWIQENAELREVTVMGAQAVENPGEALPARQTSTAPAAPTFQLDMARIQELTKETHEVVAILNEVMSEEESPQAETPPPAPHQQSSAVPPWFDGLDTRFHAPMLVLIQHDEVTAERFNRLAKDHHLLPDDLLTSVNAWSDERLGDFLLEQDDGVRIFRDLLPAH